VQTRDSSGSPEIAIASMPIIAGGGVPPLVAQILSIRLDQLGEVNAGAEVPVDRFRIGVESVRRHLELASNRRLELRHEDAGIFGGPPAEMVRQNDLC
jgi:hypothetical protein